LNVKSEELRAILSTKGKEPNQLIRALGLPEHLHQANPELVMVARLALLTIFAARAAGLGGLNARQFWLRGGRTKRLSTPDDNIDDWVIDDWASEPDDANYLDIDALFREDQKMSDSDAALEALIASNSVDSSSSEQGVQAGEQDLGLADQTNGDSPELSAASTEALLLIEPLEPGVEGSDPELSAAQVASFAEAMASDNLALRDAQLGRVDSHELVELDSKGEPFHERCVLCLTKGSAFSLNIRVYI